MYTCTRAHAHMCAHAHDNLVQFLVFVWTEVTSVRECYVNLKMAKYIINQTLLTAEARVDIQTIKRTNTTVKKKLKNMSS